MTCCFFWKKTVFFYGQKSKTKGLLENCKCFFKKKKEVIKAYFAGEGLPCPMVMSLVSIQ